MALHTKCDNCGQMFPWRSTHQCRVKEPGKFAETGPGFRVRPLYHEVFFMPRKDVAERMRALAPAAVDKAKAVVTMDRLSAIEAQRRDERKAEHE